MDHRTAQPFGELLRRHRAAAGLTQEEVAERAGVSIRGISDLERGLRRVPQRHTVSLLADALGLTADARAVFVASARSRNGQGPVLLTSHLARAAGPSAPALVGRTSELALLERHLAGQGPPILLLAGEPGLGKTRLLAEATRQAIGQRWFVLEGGCQRRGSQEPFAPLVGALSSFLSRRTPTALRDDLRGCAWLVRLLPELAGTIDEALPGLALPPDQERRLMFAAVGRLLSNVARRRVPDDPDGILLVLDDLQWAGSDALELLTDLVRPGLASGLPADHPPVRIVGAYRDTEVQPRDVLGVAMADWAQAELVTHRALGPLAAEECGRLLDELLAGAEPEGASAIGHAALRERVLQRAGGVPFFVVSYAHALRQGDVGNGADGVPWDIAQGVRQRVAALPEPARALLAAAAVVGRVAQPALLISVAARSEEDVLAGLETVSQARLLVDAGQVYQFAHDVVREVVEADIGSARRAGLHRRTAEAIEALNGEQLSDQYEVLAEHYVRMANARRCRRSPDSSRVPGGGVSRVPCGARRRGGHRRALAGRDVARDVHDLAARPPDPPTRRGDTSRGRLAAEQTRQLGLQHRPLGHDDRQAEDGWRWRREAGLVRQRPESTKLGLIHSQAVDRLGNRVAGANHREVSAHDRVGMVRRIERRQVEQAGAVRWRHRHGERGAAGDFACHEQRSPPHTAECRIVRLNT